MSDSEKHYEQCRKMYEHICSEYMKDMSESRKYSNAEYKQADMEALYNSMKSMIMWLISHDYDVV